MATLIDVFNGALAILHEPPVTDTTPKDEATRLLNLHFPSARKQCFEIGYWNFAMTRWTLARSATVPAWGYAYFYVKPSECLKIARVTDIPYDDIPDIQYAEELGMIATDSEAVYLRGVSSAYLTRLGDWSEHFAQFVSAELAGLCIKLNTSSETINRIDGVRKERSAKALAYDAMQNPPVLMAQAGTWRRSARRSSRNGQAFR